MPTQLPPVGFIWLEFTMLKPGLHMRMALAPKNSPDAPSMWMFTTVPSSPTMSVAGGVAPSLMSAGEGATAARVFVSGLPDVSAPTVRTDNTAQQLASSSSVDPAQVRIVRLLRIEAIKVTPCQRAIGHGHRKERGTAWNP